MGPRARRPSGVFTYATVRYEAPAVCMCGAGLMGDNSDQVSQSPVPTLDVTVQGGRVACEGGISGGKCLG